MTAPIEGISTEERRRQSRLDALSRRIEDHRTVRRVRNEEIIDAVGLLLLGLIALTGMANVYGGLRYLVVGGLGLVIGIGIAWAFARRGWPIWSVVLAVLAVVLVLGPSLIDPTRAWSTTVPTPGVARSLLAASFEGWADVLGTTTPVGASQGLLVLPLVSGFVVGAFSMSVARRSPRAYLAAALGPIVLLLAGLVIGTRAPGWAARALGSTIVLQGLAFTAVLLLWASLHQQEARAADVPSARTHRWGSALVVLALAAVLGQVIGNAVSGPTSQRTVVRDHVEPPLDLREAPSPLEGFRSYRAVDRADDVVFTVDGLEKGDLLRIATLDRYDGLLWQVRTNDRSPTSSGLFKRVGEQIPSTGSGAARRLEIEVGDYDAPWIPTVGPVRKVTFGGPNVEDLSAGLRYNVETNTAVEPDGLEAGDRIVVDAVVAPRHAEATGGEPGGPDIELPEMPWLAARLPSLRPTGDVSGLEELRAIADRLAGRTKSLSPAERGYLSDGGGKGTLHPDDVPSLPGHSAERMRQLLDPKSLMVGNEEQYASAMAIIADARGYPARVVVGFKPKVEAGGPVEVRAQDITAWTEVKVAGVGWVPLFPTPKDRDPDTENPKRVYPPQLLRLAPPEDVPELSAQRAAGSGAGSGSGSDDSSGLAELSPWITTPAKVLGPPLLIVGAVTAAMAGLKGRRRKRRRTRGAPSDRVAAGWEEICDLAVDFGDVVPSLATRREAAVVLARPGIAPLAQSADALLFGPEAVDDATAERYWQEVAVAREAIRSGQTRFARWKALVNPTSLRRSAGRRRRASASPTPRMPAVPKRVVPGGAT